MRVNRFPAKKEPSKALGTTAVIYIRVSSKEQQLEGFSLDSQLKFLMNYAQSKGLEVIHTYLDVESAKSPGRKEFGNLVAFLKSQSSCCTVLVEKTDRFYRNVQDLAVNRHVIMTHL